MELIILASPRYHSPIYYVKLFYQTFFQYNFSCPNEAARGTKAVSCPNEVARGAKAVFLALAPQPASLGQLKLYWKNFS
jgi:hypothetical protein